jgi:hypothetical protein
MKILEFNRSGIRLIAEICGISIRFPNLRKSKTIP